MCNFRMRTGGEGSVLSGQCDITCKQVLRYLTENTHMFLLNPCVVVFIQHCEVPVFINYI